MPITSMPVFDRRCGRAFVCPAIFRFGEKGFRAIPTHPDANGYDLDTKTRQAVD